MSQTRTLAPISFNETAIGRPTAPTPWIRIEWPLKSVEPETSSITARMPTTTPRAV
jgi:hypothetical protein